MNYPKFISPNQKEESYSMHRDITNLTLQSQMVVRVVFGFEYKLVILRNMLFPTEK